MSATTTILRKTPEGFKRAENLNDGPEWFADIRRRARASASGKLFEVVILSPSRAEALLQANPDNRKVSEQTVDKIANDIAAGRWACNGETIIVSDSFELNDGQHRCCAVIEANKAIEVLLAVGFPRATRTTTDTGRNRTVSDFLAMRKVDYSNNVAAIAAIVYGFENGTIGPPTGAGQYNILDRNTRPSQAEILTYAMSILPEIKKAISAIEIKGSGTVATHSRLCALLIVIARACKEWAVVAEFMTALVDGENLSRTSPIYKARQRLLAEKASRQLTPFKTFEIIIRAWNAYRTGAPYSRVQLMNSIPEIAV